MSEPAQNKYVEPYAKENNILQLSLFYFGRSRKKKTAVEWKDDQGEYRLECVCKYGVPGSFDQDVYTACMRIWVKEGMPSHSITLNYSDIARELKLEPKDWVGKIKESLKKLAQARYEFTQCFFKANESGTKRIDTHFSLFDTVTLYTHRKGKSKKNSESSLSFPEEIRKNLEAKYYQFLDMAWYRALPQGLPRRLYEYLEKRRYHNVNGVFRIGEKIICRWLPVKDKNTTTRRKTLARIADELIKANYLKNYEFDRKRKQCIYTYTQSGPPTSRRIIDNGKEDQEDDKPMEPSFQEALEWLDSIRYFRNEYIKEIRSMESGTVAELYPHIRRAWEAGELKTKKSIYSSFVEGEEGLPFEKCFGEEKEDDLVAEMSESMRLRYEEALDWLENLKYFRTKNLRKIKAMDPERVADLYPHIRHMWTTGKIKTRGGVYTGFVEGWKDEEFIKKQEKLKKQKKEKENRELQREMHRMKIISFIKKHGQENVFIKGEEIVELGQERITFLNHRGHRVSAEYSQLSLERDFITRKELEKHKREEEQRIKKVKEQEEAKQKKKDQQNQLREKHRLDVIDYIQKYGAKNLLLNSRPVTGHNEEGVWYENGGKKRLMKYGNIMVGLNLHPKKQKANSPQKNKS